VFNQKKPARRRQKKADRAARALKVGQRLRPSQREVEGSLLRIKAPSVSEAFYIVAFEIIGMEKALFHENVFEVSDYFLEIMSTHPFNPRPQGRGKLLNGFFEPNFGLKKSEKNFAPFPFWEGGRGDRYIVA
jgi:hypothetical protein